MLREPKRPKSSRRSAAACPQRQRRGPSRPAFERLAARGGRSARSPLRIAVPLQPGQHLELDDREAGCRRPDDGAARRAGRARAGRHPRRARRRPRRTGRAPGGLRRAQSTSSSASAIGASPHADPACGGCLYAAHRLRPADRAEGRGHPRRVRAAGTAPDRSARVASSPERGYRMRARLHVRGDRVGFYREGTHDLCDAAATGQLAAASVNAAAECVGALVHRGVSLVRDRADGERRRRRARAACRSPQPAAS